MPDEMSNMVRQSVRDIQEHRARTFSERKPYQCAHCGRRYATTGGREDHFRQVHPEFVAKTGNRPATGNVNNTDN